MTAIETDYLVIGAGAAGMAFTDALIAESDADVVMVDRRHRPGGHWNDAYPFVRLHQPAAFYGVNSRVLGTDSIDVTGPNAGFYERSSAAEICGYFARVLDDHLLPSGHVRFLGMHEYTADGTDGHRCTSRLTGATTTVRVRRKIVDATYLETPVPSTHTPAYTVDAGATLIPVNDLVTLAGPGTGYTIIGGGKTAMDACNWLLDNGVDPDAIRWIRPRDSWVLDRAFTQPLEHVGSIIEGTARNLEAAAEAEDVPDLFRRLEANGQLVRLDPTVDPGMYRCATASHAEMASLRTVEHVVRLGRVLHIDTNRITLADGTIPTDPAQIHVDCTAAGLRVSPACPIFGPDRITLQQIRTCQPTFNAAFAGYVEACRDDDGERNRLCPPNPYPDATVDWIAGTLIATQAQSTWFGEPDVMDWMERSRLNAARGAMALVNDPAMQSAMTRLGANTGPAITNLERLQAQIR